MSNFLKFILGGLVTALLGLFLINAKTLPVQMDLGARATATLAEQGHKWAKLTLNGRDAQIEGFAPSDDAKAKVLSIVDGVKGVYRVVDSSQKIAEQKPFTLNITKSDVGVVLDGFAPSDAAKLAVSAAVKAALPSATITDYQKIAAGAPAEAEWVGIANFAAQQLAKLKAGVAKLSDNTLSIEGIANGSAGYGDIMAALKALPNGLKMASANISAPAVTPYNFTTSFDDKNVSIEGFIPSVDAKQKLLDAAKALLPNGGAVNDTSQFASGQSVKFADLFGAGLSALKSLSSGGFSIKNDTLSVFGVLKQGATIEGLTSALKQFMADTSGIKVPELAAAAIPPMSAPVLTPEKQACQVKLNKMLKSNTILFAIASDRVKGISLPFLNSIISELKTCTYDGLTVLGHTDSMGQPDRNMALSELRAKAVANLLVAGGVAANKLSAIGKGETEPLALNDTPEGRALNRRIEIIVK